MWAPEGGPDEGRVSDVLVLERIPVQLVIRRLRAEHRFDAVAARFMCAGGAYACVQGVSTDAKGACEHVGRSQSCAGDEAGGLEFGRKIA